VHQADALDGPVLLKLALEPPLRDVVRQPRHKQRLEGVALRPGGRENALVLGL
jgi:hypothetical protein